MTSYKYAFQGYSKENMARVVGRDLSISTKISIEICNWLRGKPLEKAKKMLQDVIDMKRPLPIRKYSGDRGHKKGMAAGRYPIKASQRFLELMESVESNAQFKGLNTSKLHIIHIKANQASRPMHYGRHSGTLMKRTHVEVIVAEKEASNDRKKVRRAKD